MTTAPRHAAVATATLLPLAAVLALVVALMAPSGAARADESAAGDTSAAVDPDVPIYVSDQSFQFDESPQVAGVHLFGADGSQELVMSSGFDQYTGVAVGEDDEILATVMQPALRRAQGAEDGGEQRQAALFDRLVRDDGQGGAEEIDSDLDGTAGLYSDRAGTIVVAQPEGGNVLRYPGRESLTAIENSVDVVQRPDGVYLVLTVGGQIFQVAENGEILGSVNTNLRGYGIDLTSDGTVLITADTEGSSGLYSVATNGQATLISDIFLPQGFAVGPSDEAYVATQQGTVFRVPPGGGEAVELDASVTNASDVALVDPEPADGDQEVVTTVSVVQHRVTVDVTPRVGGGTLRTDGPSATATDGAGPTPTGSVSITVDGEEVGGADLQPRRGGGARAVLVYKVPAPGTRRIRASYSGDSTYAGGSDTYVRVDPTISGTLTSRVPISRSGWYRTPVTVTYRCTQGSAPLQWCPTPDTRKVTYRDTQIRGVARGEDGGRAPFVQTVRIDPFAPQLNLSPKPDGSPRCRPIDRLSGVAFCRVELGGTFVRDGQERRRWTVRAKDTAGNLKVKKGSYRVR